MSCYHPLIAIPAGVTPDGKKKMTIVHPKGRFEDLRLTDYHPDATLVPCGKCYGCRLDYSRQWADRMCLELDSSKKAIFITLTYDNEHVPRLYEGDYQIGFTLDKREASDFIKRLRRNYDGKDGHEGPYKIRFYLCGEYGSTTFRPHYHAIIFGLGLEDISDLQLGTCNALSQRYYSSLTFDRIWSRGFVTIAECSYETCAYVARYVTKKLDSSFDPQSIGAEPIFSLMSRRPGIGCQYLIDHPDCWKYEYINLPEGRKASIPRILISKLPEDIQEQIKAHRRQLGVDSMDVRIHRSNLPYLDGQAIDERVRKERVKCLSRKLQE